VLSTVKSVTRDSLPTWAAHRPSEAAAARSAPAASRRRAHALQPASAAQCSGVRPSGLLASAGRVTRCHAERCTLQRQPNKLPMPLHGRPQPHARDGAPHQGMTLLPPNSVLRLYLPLLPARVTRLRLARQVGVLAGCVRDRCSQEGAPVTDAPRAMSKSTTAACPSAAARCTSDQPRARASTSPPPCIARPHVWIMSFRGGGSLQRPARTGGMTATGSPA